MSRPKKDVPAHVHHKPTGKGRVRINGRDFYTGRWGTSEAEEAYRRIIGEYLLTGKLPGSRKDAPTPLSINELILQYWRHAEGYYVKNGKPTSELRHVRDSLRFVKNLYGSTPAAEFSPVRLKTVREEMIRIGWCRTEINKKVGRIKRAFRWAVENEMVEPTVLHGLQAVTGLRKGRSEARETKPVQPVEELVVNKTLPFLSRVVADMVRIQLLCGCRPGEICLMRPQNVNRDGAVWEFSPESHKTEHHGRQRLIFLGPRAQEILRRYLDNRPADAFCFSPKEAEAERRERQHAERTTPLSHGNRPGTNRRRKPRKEPGEQYTSDSYGKAVRAACRKARIDPPWSPNQLRHARATHVRREFGLERAQAVLGHSDAMLTASVYAERDFAEARRVMAEIG